MDNIIFRKDAVFFFSAVATEEKRRCKTKGNGNAKCTEHDEDSDESNDETVSSSQVASTASQEWIAKHRTISKHFPVVNVEDQFSRMNALACSVEKPSWSSIAR